MREFFRGVRRKLGCVTLMMACLFMGLWMRSYVVTDQVWMEGHKDTHLKEARLGSSGGSIYWIREDIWWDKLLVSASIKDGWNWIAEPDHDLGAPNNYQYSTRFWIPGAEIAIASCFQPTRNGGWFDTTSYWKCSFLWLVLPLTVLSGYLILCRPRKQDS
ncbi:MAG TPA: hypothetical protein VGM98_14065 [Schlesneria sp.]|jgi:hypothetical protein